MLFHFHYHAEITSSLIKLYFTFIISTAAVYLLVQFQTKTPLTAYSIFVMSWPIATKNLFKSLIATALSSYFKHKKSTCCTRCFSKLIAINFFINSLTINSCLTALINSVSLINLYFEYPGISHTATQEKEYRCFFTTHSFFG